MDRVYLNWLYGETVLYEILFTKIKKNVFVLLRILEKITSQG